MKTAMQELMDELAKKADSLPNTLDANVAYLVFQECYDMAKSMLEKEKDVMIDFAFKYGDLTMQEMSDSFHKEYK
jgi:hypothetical protein